MSTPSPGYSITVRVSTPATFTATSDVTNAVASTGAQITGVDVVEASHTGMTVDVSCNIRDRAHGDEIRTTVDALKGEEVGNISDRTFVRHLGGKSETTTRVQLRNGEDLSRAYTRGGVRVCQAIAKHKADARHLTIKHNPIAVVTDGSAVLGLGSLGPGAATPVMEGKAVLFKQFAGVDAWQVALDTKDTEEIIPICT